MVLHYPKSGDISVHGSSNKIEYQLKVACLLKYNTLFNLGTYRLRAVKKTFLKSFCYFFGRYKTK